MFSPPRQEKLCPVPFTQKTSHARLFGSPMKTLFSSPQRLGLADRVLPILNGEIDRRILVNYRCEPNIAARLLPAPLRPQLVNGWAMMGICLIRLTQIRPRGLPAWTGLSSENAAHRIAVEWDDGG